MIADSVNGQLPELSPDAFWDEPEPKLAHTRASLLNQDKTFEGHLKKFKLKEDEMEVVKPDSEEAKEILAEAEKPIPKLKNVVGQLRLSLGKRQGTSKDSEDAESLDGEKQLKSKSRKKLEKSLALEEGELESLNQPKEVSAEVQVEVDKSSNGAAELEEQQKSTQVDKLLDETIATLVNETL